MNDDIEADEALTRAVERMKAGALAMREAPAQDLPKIIRAGEMWRSIAMNLWAEQQTRQKDAMSIGKD